ncbi:caffeic acid 3-O-methyltransferase isoform X2 [Brachypodium distachyon]|uniref:caffeic acid 3-O-methyltransferase isoform X2 n=1 Tax=Brachypodium distachyon TaxID=15368 RepID=UPI000D0D0AAD|nr:caffeic acid 3-O-methyltransferase isoform X2 [Brachypodium distachyon]|eukprot:XP_024316364.1 caffeic acid 3-O-methyltransferase isoform X2 [Brachypodium distachyon]
MPRTHGDPLSAHKLPRGSQTSFRPHVSFSYPVLQRSAAQRSSNPGLHSRWIDRPIDSGTHNAAGRRLLPARSIPDEGTKMSAAASEDEELSPAEARLAMMELANMISVPMALTAAIRLGVPGAIWADGANAPLSAADLLPADHPDPSVLERVLRLLASRGVFSEHHGPGPAEPTRRFALTAVGRTLVPAGPSGASYADYVLQHHQDALVLAWPRLHEALLDPAGPEPFARAHRGLPAYAFYAQDKEANEVMLRGMTGVSEPFMEALLDGYAGGFEDVRTLVDVGGSSGACLDMIMRRVGTIAQGINFDLPDVVAAAPPIAE